MSLWNHFKVELTQIYERISAIQDQPAAWATTLTWLSSEGWERVSQRLMGILASQPNLHAESLADLQLYLDLMHHHLQDMQRSLELFAPWLSLMVAVPSAFMQSSAWQDFRHSLPAELPTLEDAVAVYQGIQTALNQLVFRLKDEVIPAPAKSRMFPSGRDGAALEWCQKMENDLATALSMVRNLLKGFREIASQADAAVRNMDFRFLFDDRRQVFHIGYNAATEQLDPSYYDLLASESRIASLIAIAKGDVPQSHWQHLGRPVTEVNGKRVLLSWSGTMFEYLMPTLFTKNYAGTFLSDSCYVAVDTQVHYGHDHQVPWGISESGYFAFDVDLNYQYRAFGVPDLGYQREQHNDLVIAPYASLLGLSFQPQAVLDNMANMEKLNLLGRFGFYEALDFTKTRLLPGQTHATVQSYMAHHQGMILLATCNFLLGDVMVTRFQNDERIQSVDLLLQEKISNDPPIEYPHPNEPIDSPQGVHSVTSAPWRVPVESPMPQAHILSQGDTSVLITNAGAGYSQWREFALTRWQPDTTLDQWGTWIYVQDQESCAVWSATCQPIGCLPEKQDLSFYPHKVEFQRSDNGISLRTGVTISPDGVRNPAGEYPE